MSIESAKAFIDRMKKDEAFAKKVMAIQDAEARMELVKAEGFDFTATELEPLHGELSDDELDMVAGGSYSLIFYLNQQALL